jgi:DNA modification methylase
MGSLGLEPTPDLFIRHLTDIFREVRRVLKPQGCLWVVIGDCYQSGSRGNFMRPRVVRDAITKNGSAADFARQPNRLPQEGLKDKDLVGIPWMLAFALRNDGWYWRHEGIWAKGLSFCDPYTGSSMPESVRDRPSRSHEAILMFAKSRSYYYNQDAAREPNKSESLKRFERQRKPGHKGESVGYGWNGDRSEKWNARAKTIRSPHVGGRRQCPEPGERGAFNPKGRNLRSVWAINPEPFSAKDYGIDDADHFAAFPVKLVVPMIRVSSPEGGCILDPFMGTGTVGWAATQLGRRFIGIDAAEPYVEMARRRIAGGALLAVPFAVQTQHSQEGLFNE